MKPSIFEILQDLNLTSQQTRELYNARTRDRDHLNVWRDKASGVIYINDFYIGDETYIDGTYRVQQNETGKASVESIGFESIMDAQRRTSSHRKFVTGKRLVDFGCGAGDFLRRVQNDCVEVCGVELQQNYVDALKADDIRCEKSLDAIKNDTVDVCVSFHVIEHLPDPLSTLRLLKDKIISGGMLIIEVPHANDFLLSVLNTDAFKQSTLWSQHLILHTRESLRRMLMHVGFEDVRVEGVQRYPLSNHLNWLAEGKGGGHKSATSLIDSLALNNAYSDSLARIDATDTLVAVAKVP